MTGFKQIEKKVTEIVNKVDPDNLVSYGAPEDEYLTQVHRVISILTRVKDHTVWQKEFSKVFFVAQNNITPESEQKISQLTDLLKVEFPHGINLQDLRTLKK